MKKSYLIPVYISATLLFSCGGGETHEAASENESEEVIKDAQPSNELMENEKAAEMPQDTSAADLTIGEEGVK